MSITHSMVFTFCKKGKRRYVSGQDQNYPARRAEEEKQNRFASAPRSVRIRRVQAGSVTVELLRYPKNPTDRIILYLHGGGFVVGSVKTRRMFTGYLAAKLGYNVAAPEYRLAPEYPFPAAPQDCFAAYRALLKEYAPEHIVLVGESAGGNLVLSVLLQIRQAGLPMPAAALCFSPCVQFDKTLPSYLENRSTEAMVDDLWTEVQETYLGIKDSAAVRDPLAAPYYGSFAGCPPICLWASDSEVLRDDSLLLFEKLKAEGHPCRLYLRKGMIHTWLIIPTIPEAKKDLKTVKDCLDRAMEGTLRGCADPIRLEDCNGQD
ncbi:MAG TPA: alpha/beta hydrolase [Candidatus Anaerofilum excrementigallinarum]|nr:alpha/beta hydrolase [Candidatus Anaerofilum excrementigallinarum]